MNFTDEPEENQESEQPEMDATSKAKLASDISRTLAAVAESLRELGDLPPAEEKEYGNFK